MPTIQGIVFQQSPRRLLAIDTLEPERSKPYGK
jgi:hypothetical protein